MTANNNNNKLRLINPDPIRTTNPHTTSSSTTKKLCGNGSNSSYRHIHHQRGTIGTFHVRLLEANNLSRKHWSVLSLGHLKHLGLSNSHGEVSSFGTLRLGFWQDDENNGGGSDDSQEENNIDNNQRVGDGLKTTNDEDDCNNSVSSSSISSGSAYHEQQTQQQLSISEEGKSPLTPLLFDQGSIKSVSSSSANGRSPFLQSYPSRQQTKVSSLSTPPRSSLMQTEADDKPQQLPIPSPLSTKRRSTDNNSGTSSSSSSSSSSFGLPPPHHYAKEEYKSTTVHSDNNPIWHGGSSNVNSNNNMESSDGSNTFNIPLHKDDLLPTIHNDGGKVKLEIRIDEELSNTEKLSGGALSTAVSAASVATSVVGIGKQTKDVSTKGMELLGLSTDRLIGKGVVDLMPLLLGYWDESNDTSSDIGSSKEEELQDSSLLNEYGQISQSAYRMRRRIGQLELLDVWVPLYHPSVTQKANNKEDEHDKATIETSGKVHLLISYTPNGMIPKPDDIVAFESFARRPISNTSSSIVNVGPVITPIIPPLSPLLVIQTRGQYLLLEYSTSRTITSVDRNGNVKSSRYERSHRTRVHRNAVFVIERHTLLDAAGNIARLPGDIVLSTPIGQEIVQASAPLVAGAMELVGPAVLGGKLMMAAGWTGVKVSLAGARAATEAVVVASQEKALERRRDGGQSDRSGDAGAYGYIG